MRRVRLMRNHSARHLVLRWAAHGSAAGITRAAHNSIHSTSPVFQHALQLGPALPPAPSAHSARSPAAQSRFAPARAAGRFCPGLGSRLASTESAAPSTDPVNTVRIDSSASATGWLMPAAVSP